MLLAALISRKFAVFVARCLARHGDVAGGRRLGVVVLMGIEVDRVSRIGIMNLSEVECLS